MTGLEHMLASIIRLIEQAKLAGDAPALAGLVRRKEVICAALAAPEQSWTVPPAVSPDAGRTRAATAGDGEVRSNSQAA